MSNQIRLTVPVGCSDDLGETSILRGVLSCNLLMLLQCQGNSTGSRTAPVCCSFDLCGMNALCMSQKQYATESHEQQLPVAAHLWPRLRPKGC